MSKKEKSKTINALRFTKPQGVYLYDKGENDELFHVIVVSQPIYKYILTCFLKKVKKFLKIFFKVLKIII